MTSLDNPFHHVRCELFDVGLLFEGNVFDQVDLVTSWIPSGIEKAGGMVWDERVSWHRFIIGFREGNIYIPYDIPKKFPRLLRDIIRHEFAHVWAWTNPGFFGKPWFRQTFGGRYFDNQERAEPKHSAFYYQQQHLDFASSYAITMVKEDFAETFMVFMRCRHNLKAFSHRPGFYKKLKAVREAVKLQAKQFSQSKRRQQKARCRSL